MLEGKKIILGITASIAAYKAAVIIRLLIKEGAEVQVVMTPAAREFITPVTLSALSGKPVLCDFFSDKSGSWNSHVDLGVWADLYLVAPVTASTMGKMAGGIADNLLLTTYLSAKCQVMLAPAMDLDMYRHPSTVRNLATLKSYGNLLIEPGTGELASGLFGKGRMEEPETIVGIVKDYFAAGSQPEKKKETLRLEGKKILITAGPTMEAIDPVRFISNHSSGKMGYAIAEACAREGARVYLISGPVNIMAHHPNIQTVPVTSATEMYREAIKYFSSSDVGIMTAAVADFAPGEVSLQKIKPKKSGFSLELVPTRDIAAELGKKKKKDQVLVGFALETGNGEEYAIEKLFKKNFDFIVLNTLSDKGAGFGFDTNRITMIDRENNIQKFELKNKDEVAKDILTKLLAYV